MHLPISRKEVEERGWDYIDAIIVSGDAYVDHPSFGHAVIARILESAGLRVAVLPQPNWQDDLRDFKKLGAPRLFFGVTSGCMDSMVNHYTANKRLRSDDAYTPGGAAGFRPDRAAVVYSQILKNIFPDTPVILGGIEASLRRATHYDYWSDKLLPSILTNSKADLLVYGMGEKPILEIARKLQNGENIYNTKQIAYLAETHPNADFLRLHSHEDCLNDSDKFLENTKTIEKYATSCGENRSLIQKTGTQTLIINPPFEHISETEIDKNFDLPYERIPHPRYKKRGNIPAYEMIKNSITTHRGCFGGCAFCAIHAHQGKFVVSRSEKSILKEIKILSEMQGFSGVISDLGGPTANMYRMSGTDKSLCSACKRQSCVYPGICGNLCTNHKPINDLLREVRKIKGINKIFIGSGVRYDLILNAKDKNVEKENLLYAENLIIRHTSGRLKLAPEHTENEVLKIMRKPIFELYENFLRFFHKICAKHNLKTQIMPYLMSGHPGCTEKDMANLAKKMRNLNIKPEQVQDFTPTPFTMSTALFYLATQKNKNAPPTATNSKDKQKQKDYFFWHGKPTVKG